MFRSLLLPIGLALLLPASLGAQSSVGLRSGVTNVHAGLNQLFSAIRLESGRSRNSYSWENEIYYNHRLRSGLSFQAAVSYTKREQQYYIGLAPQHAAFFDRYRTGIVQLQLAALYDCMKFVSPNSRFQVNAGLALIPSLFFTNTFQYRSAPYTSDRHEATDYGISAGLLLQPAYTLTRHLTVTASLQLQELIAASSLPYGYIEKHRYGGRHSYSLGLAYKFQ